MPLHSSYRRYPTACQPDNATARRACELTGAEGFTLIELLIVCLIVSILAAIAIPLLASPRENAVSAQAKTLAGSASTAVEAFAADNSGSYVGLSPTALHKQEPDISVSKNKGNAYVSRAKGTTTGYTITAKATNGVEFTITDTAGEMKRTCVSTLSKTGCNGSATSNW